MTLSLQRPANEPGRADCVVYNFRILRMTPTTIIYACNRGEKVVVLRRMRRK